VSTTPARRLLAPLLLALVVAAILVGCGASTLPNVRSDTERIATAKKMIAQKRWVSAIDVLKDHVQRGAGSADIDVAIYLLGYSYLGNKDWALAANEFERLVRDYPESDSTPSAAFRLGEAWYGQARPPDFDQEFTAKALAQWRNYRDTYPDHWLVPDADRKIAEARSRLATKIMNNAYLYMKLKLPGPARVYYDQVVNDYSDTPMVGYAMIGQAQADAMMLKRDEAIARLKQVEANYAGKPEAEHARRERLRLEHQLN
jgi:outer membrane protein assembly factor BamD